jgi:hypothetical protein
MRINLGYRRFADFLMVKTAQRTNKYSQEAMNSRAEMRKMKGCISEVQITLRIAEHLPEKKWRGPKE